MAQFKIIFPTRYIVRDLTNDYLDVNVYLPNGDVYFASLFTLQQVSEIMERNSDPYFWSTDMIIIKDLNKASIRLTINRLVEGHYLEEALSKIGTINKYGYKCYADVIDECPDPPISTL